MALLDAITSHTHAPTVQVYISGLPVGRVVSIQIDSGYDIVSSSAQVRLAVPPSFPVLRKSLEILMGYDGFMVTVFKGFVEDDTLAYSPQCQIGAAGFLKLAQHKHSGELTFSSQTDTLIVGSLLNAAGIVDVAISGAEVSLATPDIMYLRDGQTTFDLINQIDQTLGYHTFDTPSGVVRRMYVSGIPTAGAAFSYTQGVNIISVVHPSTVSGISNYIRVIGAHGSTAYRQADNPFVPNPPGHVSYEFRSDVIQNDTLAGTVAVRLMEELNRVMERIDVTVPGNPYLSPGMTIAIQSDMAGLPVATPYWLRHVSHSFDSRGFFTRLTLEGGVGQDGWSLNLKPHAEFTVTVSAFVGYDSALHYAVLCDGSSSWSPAFSPDQLTYNWTTNKTGSGSGKLFTLELVAADLTPTPTVTLTVTDPDGNTDALTRSVPIEVSSDLNILARELYVAAGSRAEASIDGTTWNTWSPGGSVTVISTAQVNKTYGLFGLSDGGLYYTLDRLATSPTLVHTFPSAVNCIWINEQSDNRVWVGTEGGGAWLCEDISLLGSSVWTLMRTYADPVHWIVETSTIGNVWVCAGSYLSITFDNFTSDALQVSFSGSTTTLAMSYFGNFVSALNSSTGAPPAYSPPLGTGDRRSIITVSATVKHRSNFSGGVLADLVDGSRSSPNINFGDPDNAYIAPNVAGLYLRFDFGTFQIMTECTVYWTLTSSRLHGIWQWQGSADGSSWTNIGSTFDASTSNVYTSLSANTSSYRYYQIMGVSGDSGGTVFGPSCAEFEFKIGALAGNDVVKSADDSTVKLNETHSVRGLTHHIRDAILWAVDDVGDFYEMVSPASALTLVGPTGVGVAYSMQRDGDQQQVLYLAGSAGLYASFNMGRTWHQLRDYSGVGLDGLALGYGLLGGKSLVAVTVYSIVTVPVKTLWNGVSNDAQPTGWKDASYDASAWSSAVEAAHTGSVLSDAAAKAIWKTTPAVSTTEQNLFRQEFTLGLGRITSANITVNLKDSAAIWINGAFLTNAIHSTSGVEYSIDSLMLKSGVNLIEAYVINTADTEAWVAWKLVVA